MDGDAAGLVCSTIGKENALSLTAQGEQIVRGTT